MSFWAGVLFAPLVWYVAVMVVVAIRMGIGALRQWRDDREWRRLVNTFGVARAVEMRVTKGGVDGRQV